LLGKELKYVGTTVKLAPLREKERAVLSRIEKEAGTSINLCYQCGKCSAGCPVGFAMDYTPRQIVRLLQLDMINEALSAESIWICASCDTCSARCPRGVDIAALMDALRREALSQGKISDKKVAVFNEAFLGGVRYFGRTFEAGLLIKHNLKTMQPFKDAELGLPMMTRGKLHLLPARIKGREEVKKIFERAEKMGGEQE
jgi:heterodisulfide reductase subunit C